MYAFVYFFMKKVLERRNPDPYFAAATYVTLLQVVHFLFLFVISRFFINDNIYLPKFSDTYTYNKLAAMPFMLVWMVVVHKYFKKRYSEIEKQYDDKNIVTLKNGIVVIGLLLIPLFIAIRLSIKN